MLSIPSLIALPLLVLGAGDPPEWGGFRGNNGAGVSTSKGLPDALDVDVNAVWRAELPRGYSSPTFADGVLFVTGAEGGELVTIALDAESGEELWRAAAEYDGSRIGQNSPAAASPVTDGEYVFVVYHHLGMIAYDVAGKEVWRHELGKLNIPHGISTSPLVHGETVVLLVDQDVDAYLAAFDRTSGTELWTTKRPGVSHSYSTPALYVPEEGPVQIVVLGSLEVSGYSLEDGRRLWWSQGSGWMTKSLPVFDGDLCILNAHVTSTAEFGAPKANQTWEELLSERDADGDGLVSKAEWDDEAIRQLWFLMDLDRDGMLDASDWKRTQEMQTATGALFAIEMGGEGDVSESHRSWTYDDRRGLSEIPSPVVADGTLFLVADGGIVSSLDPSTGKLEKRERVGISDSYYASPVAGDGKVYLASQSGQLAVLSAERDWKVLSTSKLGEEVWSTPAIAGGRVYVRSLEALYCFEAE